MKKYLAGYTEFNNTKECFYTDDFKTFYSKNDKELEESDLEFWAEWINSPWSQAHEFYKISINCKDAYTEMNKNDPKFKCEYIILGYEGVASCVIGYGNTEYKALSKCKKLFRYLQNNYNKNNKSI